MMKNILKEVSSSIIAFAIVSIFLYIINPNAFLPYNKWDVVTYKSMIFLYLYVPAIIALAVYYVKKEVI